MGDPCLAWILVPRLGLPGVETPALQVFTEVSGESSPLVPPPMLYEHSQHLFLMVSCFWSSETGL